MNFQNRRESSGTCISVEEDDDTESRHEEEKEEVKCYSRRKVFSNWSRYEDTEKEGQSEAGESQRGTDFSVLLSSAGDSFTQFRFADEKEWDKESICHKQFSALSVDCQSLVQALQELPLHLRLNVAAELVQVMLKPDRQVEGGNSHCLFCPCEIPPGELHPVLGSSAQERHRPVGVSAEEGHKVDQRVEHISCEGRLRVGVLQAGEQKAPGTPYSTFQYLKQAYRAELERDFSHGHV
uniref:Apoptosis and caspase activation inhibitor n=1 Tax=Catharus ustulatus TaxID=91951 RepID=A0A8C3VBH9_CATUS